MQWVEDWFKFKFLYQEHRVIKGGEEFFFNLPKHYLKNLRFYSNGF